MSHGKFVTVTSLVYGSLKLLQCQVVIKLFHIVEPDVAFFGQKDYQQLQVINRMTRDLDMAVRIEAVPIMREPDGLAMSRSASSDMHLPPMQLSGSWTAHWHAQLRSHTVFSGCIIVTESWHTMPWSSAKHASSPFLASLWALMCCPSAALICPVMW